MDYISLNHKYRPKKLSEVLGQESIVNILKNSIDSNRIYHSFLFYGTRGTGKTTVARILAKSLICKNKVTSNPCLKCTFCVSIDKSSSIDVLEIDGASNTGVDDIRSLKEIIKYRPTDARFKIIIIDEVHMLSMNAFNALLKTIEEPPRYVKFIFATTNIHKLPNTIISRCQHYNFKKIKLSIIKNNLKRILLLEKKNITNELMLLILKSSDGCMRDALNLLDQILVFSNENFNISEIRQIMGILNRNKIMKTVYSLIEGDATNAMLMIEYVYSNGLSVLNFINKVTDEIRNICIAKICNNIEKLINLTEIELFDLKKYSKKLNINDIERILSIIIEFSGKNLNILDSRTSIELLFLKILNRPPISEIYTISYAIDKLEKLTLKNFHKYSKLRNLIVDNNKDNSFNKKKK